MLSSACLGRDGCLGSNVFSGGLLTNQVQSIMDLHWTLSTNGTSCTFWVYTSEPLKMVWRTTSRESVIMMLSMCCCLGHMEKPLWRWILLRLQVRMRYSFMSFGIKKIHEHRNGNGKKGSVRKQIMNIGVYLWSMSSESNRIGSVVRAFTSHQCGLSSNPGVG